MVKQHPSIIQRTSVVPPDWLVLSLFWLRAWESLQRDKVGVLRTICVRALEEVLVLEHQQFRHVTVGASLFASEEV